VLKRLTDIRAAIAVEVRDAAGLRAVRAALMRMFDRFVVRRHLPRVHVELILEPQLVIEPVVREEAIEGYSENLQPILRREPLSPHVDNQRVGLPTRELFKPISVGAARPRGRGSTLEP